MEYPFFFVVEKTGCVADVDNRRSTLRPKRGSLAPQCKHLSCNVIIFTHYIIQLVFKGMKNPHSMNDFNDLATAFFKVSAVHGTWLALEGSD